MSLKITFPDNPDNSEYVVISAEITASNPYAVNRFSPYDSFTPPRSVFKETRTLMLDEAIILRDQLRDKINVAMATRRRNFREAKRREIVAEINDAEKKAIEARQRLQAFDEGREEG